MSYKEHFKNDFLENVKIGNELVEVIWSKVDATESNYLEIGKELFLLKRVLTKDLNYDIKHFKMLKAYLKFLMSKLNFYDYNSIRKQGCKMYKLKYNNQSFDFNSLAGALKYVRLNKIYNYRLVRLQILSRALYLSLL